MAHQTPHTKHVEINGKERRDMHGSTRHNTISLVTHFHIDSDGCVQHKQPNVLPEVEQFVSKQTSLRTDTHHLPHMINPAQYDVTESWVDYKTHFDKYVRLNGWSEEENDISLAVALRDQAQYVLGQLGAILRQS